VCVVLASAAVSTANAAHPLRTGFHDPSVFAQPGADRSFARARGAGASFVRVTLHWSAVADERPDDPDDPDDPAYAWGVVDRQVAGAVRAGLEPVVGVNSAPAWARGRAVGLPGTWPSPARYAQFARVAARRYSGNFTPQEDTVPLPRVRLWQAWNEPNAGRFLSPQRVNGRAVSPTHYRRMVNAFAVAVKAVQRSNRVVAGTLGPFGHNSKDIQVVAPLAFMSALLCVSMEPPHRRTCSTRTRFDIWAHNPYTNGDPSRQAHSPADVSIGDLPEMHALLLAAERRGTIISPRAPDFWVNEISWDSSPPDPHGVPTALHARWVSEALYRIWRAGVTTVMWWRLQDDPLRETPYQSGFFTAGGKAKRSLEAFRFPFVAFRTPNGVTIWGRTPSGRRGSVIVQRFDGGRWGSVARVPTDGYGIFTRRLAASASSASAMRARLVSPSEYSLPFSLTVPPARRTTPFGCGGPISC
jgi:hypothetical protein